MKPIPRNIYLLRHAEGGFVLAIDGAVDVLMAFTNRKDAESEAERQNELYGLNCEAVKAKGATR